MTKKEYEMTRDHINWMYKNGGKAWEREMGKLNNQYFNEDVNVTLTRTEVNMILFILKRRVNEHDLSKEELDHMINALRTPLEH